MIDKKTGNIELATGQVIYPSMSLERIKSMGIGESQTEREIGNGWIWHDVRNVQIQDQYFSIAFAFYNNKLNIITLIINNTRFNSNNGADPWSEKEEMQRAIIFNNWLNAEIGSERTFSWGEVWAGYDPKGGFSSITIRYKK